MSSIQIIDDNFLDKIVGIQINWSGSSPTWAYIDCDGSPKTPPSGWQNSHPILKNIKTCTIMPGFAPVFGSNPRGDGLSLDGTLGQVMARIPAVYGDRWFEGDVEKIIFSPMPGTTPGGRNCTKHPAYFARGGWERSEIFVSRYYGGLAAKTDGTLYMLSASGLQPWTGGEMVELSFSGGSVAPVAGQVIQGATSKVKGIVVAHYVASGSFAGGDATGKIWLRMVSTKITYGSQTGNFTVGQIVTGATSGAKGLILADNDAGTSGTLTIDGTDASANLLNFSAGEALSDPMGGAAALNDSGLGDTIQSFSSGEGLQVSGSTIATATSTGSAKSLTCSEADAYARAYAADTRWGALNPYTLGLLTSLFYLDKGTCDAQTAVGRGVVDKPWTRQYGGELNGANSVDSNIDIYGTGIGIGINGKVAAFWRGMELWGGVFGACIGIQPNTGGKWNIINPNGLYIPTSPLTAGTYLSTIGSCLMSDGYWGRPMKEAVAKWLDLPEVADKTSVTGRCDYYYYPRYSPGVLLVGGGWGDGSLAGVACRYACCASSNSYRSVGGRLEFLP
jgi:hypothetical protein